MPQRVRLERYQNREPCPYCRRPVKLLQKQAHIRYRCDKAPEDKKREPVSVSVKDKWRPRFGRRF